MTIWEHLEILTISIKHHLLDRFIRLSAHDICKTLGKICFSFIQLNDKLFDFMGMPHLPGSLLSPSWPSTCWATPQPRFSLEFSPLSSLNNLRCRNRFFRKSPITNSLWRIKHCFHINNGWSNIVHVNFSNGVECSDPWSFPSHSDVTSSFMQQISHLSLSPGSSSPDRRMIRPTLHLYSRSQKLPSNTTYHFDSDPYGNSSSFLCCRRCHFYRILCNVVSFSGRCSIGDLDNGLIEFGNIDTLWALPFVEYSKTTLHIKVFF